jgi:3-isopropylmalate/(R)-2-methylmalate dehydratase large subunit
MPSTLIEKILASHSGQRKVCPGDIIELFIDARAARDFGGANVVKNLDDAGLGVHDPSRTFFTFDCNPTGSDQKYAQNQQTCRMFAERHGIRVYDIDAGIGTHLAVENGLVSPGATLVSTDSHANILGAIGAFGQGMGDADIAGAWAFGKVWFEVPPTVKVLFSGQPGPGVTPKDLALAALARFGADGLLGRAAELYGPAIDALDLAGRMTLSSLSTEMGAIIALIPPTPSLVDELRKVAKQPFEPVFADPDATYEEIVEIHVDGLGPLASRPGQPENVVAVVDLPPTRVDSVFIGSCTNGRIEDLRAAAAVLSGRKVFPGVVLKIVPATDGVWRQALAEGLVKQFKEAGALFGNAGCAGCAAGQIGQNGPGETTVSTGNRNFAGKQGKGDVWLASPATAAASAVGGVLVTARMLAEGSVPERPRRAFKAASPKATGEFSNVAPVVLEGSAWVVDIDNVDTDMIFHNRHLAETDPAKMGQYAFGNLPGWEDFPQKARLGDILVLGANFGCGSSRQQAVTCFRTLGISVLVGRSFGAIYERNAINEALPVLRVDWKVGCEPALQTGDRIRVDLASGRIQNLTRNLTLQARPFAEVALSIYRRGGLLKG